MKSISELPAKPATALGFTTTFLTCALSGVLGLAACAQTPSAPAPIGVPAGAPAGAPSTIHLEAESGKQIGTTISTARAGFTGAGYVNGLDQDGDKIEFTIPNAKAGLYEVRLRYSASGEKGYDLTVNGSKISAMMPRSGDAFATTSGGKIELKDGLNTVVWEKGWGYYDLDSIDFVPVKLDLTLKKPPKTLVDAQADAKTRALFSYLVDNYGQKTVSGQHEAGEFPYIREVSGKAPAILGGDLIEYSPTRVAFGAKPEGTTEQLIKDARAGHILTVMWHWNAPAGIINEEKHVDPSGKVVNALWWRGFYTEGTTFDLAKVLADPQSPDYQKMISDIDTLAIQLKKLQAAGIPVLWRPLHEAEGGWFWWGAKGPDPFKQLWRIMFDRLTKTHGLHNLIWVYTGTAHMDWYPGDDVVDIIGVDAYPTDAADPLSSSWEDLKKQFDGKKLLALSEFGGVPDLDKMRRYGVRWSYYMSWTKELGAHKITKEDLARIYQSPLSINQSDLKPPLNNAAQVVQPR